jgi:hypothetical protein
MRAASGRVKLEFGDAADFYATWPTPTVIISDGAYGTGGFDGDTPSAQELPAWYERHIAAWSKYARSSTTLWLWGTEIGWACVHPALAAAGWLYRGAQIWDKGPERLSFIGPEAAAGRFPPVSELVAHYVRSAGGPEGPKWHPIAGLTNVWSVPSNRGAERLRAPDGELAHPNQKPLILMERLIAASSDPGDVVWEPFGGLCSGIIAAARLGRHGFAAEMRPAYYRLAQERIERELG